MPDSHDFAKKPWPLMMTIAGSDCSGGAGLQADIKTACAQGVYALSAVTCVVSETPRKVSQIVPMMPEFVVDQIELLLSDFPVAAIKTGMLYSAEIIEAVAWSLQKFKGALVVDPVMVATNGASLLLGNAKEIYETQLFPQARLLTPNMDEASVLLGQELKSLADLEFAAKTLAQNYGCSVLVKGGHLPANEPRTDVLFELKSKSCQHFSSQDIPGVSTHGTGCSLSAAIASRLAHGDSLAEAVEAAKLFISNAIQNFHRWKMPSFPGKVDALHHFAPIANVRENLVCPQKEKSLSLEPEFHKT